ncbi:MAG: membrane protein insertase YidC [candidate division WOR-3 bacterium]
MEDPKRLILAFVLVMAILFLYQIFFSPNQSPPPRPPSEKKEEPAKETKEEFSPPGEVFTLENSKIAIKLSNYGGSVRSVYLKEYDCQLLRDFPHFSLTVLEESTAFRLDTLIWNGESQPAKITFWIKEGEFLFSRSYWLEDDYQLCSEISLPPAARKFSFAINFDRGLSFTEQDTNEDYNHFRVLFYKGKMLKEVPFRKLKGEWKEKGDWDWFGFATKYFLMVVKGEFDSLRFVPAPRRVKSTFFSTPEEKMAFSLSFYPLKYKLLAKRGEGLAKAIPLGWPKFLSLAILHLLLFLHSLFRNYGLVIIIFSFLMKGILFPLTRFQLREMRKLQQLQPKLEELKRKYKDDPKTLNQETLRLYSIHRMNPLSGCLPLLAQIPIFWALYSVLRSTFELRRAGFIFWLKDLSQKDPFYLLPILMGISFLFQNLLTSQDKKNIFVTIFFPVFLTVIFLKFPSGLQLYWLTFNLLSLVESFIFQRGGKKWKR